MRLGRRKRNVRSPPRSRPLRSTGLRGALDRIGGIAHRHREPGLAEHFEVVFHVAQDEDLARWDADALRQHLDQSPLVDAVRDHVAIIGL
jgi:hypothetical protein